MEIVFKNENVIIEKEEQQGKTEIFVRALKGDLLAAHSLAVQVNYLQEKNDLLSENLKAENHHLSTELNEAKTKISNAIDALESENFEDIPYNVACALGAE